MKLLCILILLSGCSLFKKGVVERDLSKSTQKICLSSHGKGRLMVKKNKYIFSYESALDTEHALWQLALNFPLRKTESFKLDWSQEGKVNFESTIEERILKENKNIDPKSLESFTSAVGYLLEEIIKIRTKSRETKRLFRWKVTKKAILVQSRDKKINAEFKNLVANQYFGLMTIKYENASAQTYKLDLIVRKCLEN